jgi:prominin 1
MKSGIFFFFSLLQNGFWASIGWCLVLFIPAIILSVKLAALYQKSDPYPGPLVES